MVYPQFDCRFLHPLVFGDYPDIMKKNAGTRIPALTRHDFELVKGSFDFIGLNHYATFYIKDDPSSHKMEIRDVNTDIAATIMCTHLAFAVSLTFDSLNLTLPSGSTTPILPPHPCSVLCLSYSILG